MQLIAIMLDSARCLENRAYYRKAIEFAAARGVNAVLWHFTDDQGCTLQFDSVPGIGSPNAYSKQEMQDLVASAKSKGVTLIPELASLGHSRFITRLPKYRHLDEIEHVFTGMCPVAEETRSVLALLMAEVAEVFDSPWIHCGLDEANIGHHPLTREALKTRTKADITADHINFMHGLVKQHGRTMMIWGDGLLHDRDIAPRLRRDIIICDWQYGADVSGETTRYFLDEGFNVVLCPALISFNQPTFPGDQLAISNLRSILRHRTMSGRGKILGVIETIWQPERYMHDAMWLPMDLAISMLLGGPGVSIDVCTRHFAEQFYGFSPSDAWVAAVGEIYRIAPCRQEWLAVAKLELDALPGTLTSLARSWRLIVETLRSAEPAVTQNRTAYGVFLLTMELIAHLYVKAEAVLAGKAHWPSYVAAERTLVAAVDAAWDRERFADDPKKFEPSREVMRDNHLLPLLRNVLRQTEKQARETTRGDGARSVAATAS